MIKRLIDKKLITYNKIKGVKLTTEGLKTALTVVKGHRLWETFLHNKFGYSWIEVHDIAEQLEHVHHLDLYNRLEKFLGFPQFNPFGEAIPDANGNFPEIKSYPLSEYNQQKTSTVMGLVDTSSAFLKYLDQIGIHIGTEIKVEKNYDFDNSIDIMINGKMKIHISQQVAQNILIRPSGRVSSHKVV